ncbi:hypothetical protein BZL29_8525 [Mycobacterium kansasii]|uniref:Uncharacterized protein n=1 Tax=Mycobacterium kansasii TaxID=1768 RepID=A0A1V3W930_MYCKA|nr:hypothetical protein BZL29_8525 [Mycobacterium kansasii]
MPLERVLDIADAADGRDSRVDECQRRLVDFGSRVAEVCGVRKV